MSCPPPIQLNCPAMQCPPPPPCNPFPTLAPFSLPPQSNGAQGIAQFTLPTFSPLPGSPFGGLISTTPPTPLPQPVVPPTNGQESLVPIQNTQYNAAQQQIYQQQQQVPQAPPPPQVSVEVPPPAQIGVQPSGQFAETIPIDATTKATTLPSESYVEADSPENGLLEELPNEKSFPLYENQPNHGYRQPARRALAAPVGAKPEVFTDKCNDERLKKIIEENIDANPSSSKRKIQKAATDEIGGLFDVICSSHDFSYLANTQLFCEAGNDDVTCFAFLHSLIQ